MLMAERWADRVYPGLRTPPKLLPRSIEKPSGTDCYISNLREYDFHQDGGGSGGGYRSHSGRHRSAGAPGTSELSAAAGRKAANKSNNSKHYLSKRELANHYSKQSFGTNHLHTTRVTVDNIRTVKQRDAATTGNSLATTPRSARGRRSALDQGDAQSQKSLDRWVDTVNEDNHLNQNGKRFAGSAGKSQRTPRNNSRTDMDNHSTVSAPTVIEDTKSDSPLKVSALSGKNGTALNGQDQWEASSVSSRSSARTSASTTDKKSKSGTQSVLSPRSAHGGADSAEPLPSLGNRRHSITASTVGDFLSPRGSVSSRLAPGSDSEVVRPATSPIIVPNIDTILDLAMKQVDDTHRVQEQLNFVQTRKKDFNSKSSQEFKRVLEQINAGEDESQCKDQDGGPRLRRPNRKLSRNWSSLKTKLRNTVAQQRGGTPGTGGNNRRASEAVPTISEEKEGEEPDKSTTKGKKKVEAMSRPLGKGWLFIKTNMKNIIRLADEGKIQPGPHFRQPVHNPFKSIRDIILGKEFQMMMRRKSSFIENGVFQFEAAKNDLYARYKSQPGAENGNNFRKHLAKRLSGVTT